jgi:hypothetical protein
MPFTPFYVRVILDPQTVNITVDLALRTCDPASIFLSASPFVLCLQLRVLTVLRLSGSESR